MVTLCKVILPSLDQKIRGHVQARVSVDWVINHLRMWRSKLGFYDSQRILVFILFEMIHHHHHGLISSSVEADSLRLGFWPLVNPNQLHWANQGMARRWGLQWLWGSFHDYIELMEARVSSLSHFIRRLGLRLISALPDSSISWKSQLWSTVLDFMDLEVGESWIHFIHVETSFIWHVKAQEWRK